MADKPEIDVVRYLNMELQSLSDKKTDKAKEQALDTLSKKFDRPAKLSDVSALGRYLIGMLVTTQKVQREESRLNDQALIKAIPAEKHKEGITSATEKAWKIIEANIAQTEDYLKGKRQWQNWNKCGSHKKNLKLGQKLWNGYPMVTLITLKNMIKN